MAINPDDERQPLLSATANPLAEAPSHRTDTETITFTFGLTKFILALLGVFLANADTSLVVATYPSIASEFRDLGDGPWLLTVYTLGFSVALPAYGATSDTFGRKKPLLVAYCLFCVGCTISGSALSLEQIVAGRVISGLGGAGITTLVSIIITGKLSQPTSSTPKWWLTVTDLAPLSQVAVLRSYVNLAAVVGRSAGGPIGGLLFDSIGWRWSFFVQIPIVLGCFITALWQSLPKVESKREKRTLDVLGLIALAMTMISFLLLVDIAGKGAKLRSPLFIALAVSFALSAVAFVLVETYWVQSPIISPTLIVQEKLGSYFAVQTLLLIAQFSMISNTATYFARTENASNSIAALHITPGPVGNAVGALIAGKIISRTKSYKALSISAASLSIASFVLIMLRWRGRISVWESLEILPASLGVGLLNSSQFIGMSAAVEKSDLATAISIFFLSQQIGMMVGASASAALLRHGFRDALIQKLTDWPDRNNIVKDVLADGHAATYLPKALQAMVLSSYVHGFLFVSVLSVCSSSLTLPFLVLLPKRTIE